MKALSLGLVRGLRACAERRVSAGAGTVDEVAQKAILTWVQPRVLDLDQASASLHISTLSHPTATAVYGGDAAAHVDRAHQERRRQRREPNTGALPARIPVAHLQCDGMMAIRFNRG